MFDDAGDLLSRGGEEAVEVEFGAERPPDLAQRLGSLAVAMGLFIAATAFAQHDHLSRDRVDEVALVSVEVGHSARAGQLERAEEVFFMAKGYVERPYRSRCEWGLRRNSQEWRPDERCGREAGQGEGGAIESYPGGERGEQYVERLQQRQ